MSTADARSTEMPTPFLAKRPDELDPAQRALYAQIIGGKRSNSPVPLRDADGRLYGPFGPMLLAPAIGSPLQDLGAAIRFGSSLDDTSRETIILAVAAERRSEFEWYVHAEVSHALGIEPSIIDAISNGEEGSLPGDLPLFAQVGRCVAAGNGIPSARSVRRQLGDSVFFEALATAGYYTLLAELLAAFEIGLPEGVKPHFAGRRV